MSTTGSLWLRWKSLRLPWRRHILIGQDLIGNTYWEFQPTLRSTARPRRIVRSRSQMSDVQISPQWHQWLRQTRREPPSIQEQIQDVQREAQLKVNAKLADDRWAEKGTYIEQPKKNRREAFRGQQGMEQKKEAVPKEDPWAHARETGINPSASWKPEVWTPASKKS